MKRVKYAGKSRAENKCKIVERKDEEIAQLRVAKIFVIECEGENEKCCHVSH